MGLHRQVTEADGKRHRLTEAWVSTPALTDTPDIGTTARCCNDPGCAATGLCSPGAGTLDFGERRIPRRTTSTQTRSLSSLAFRCACAWQLFGIVSLSLSIHDRNLALPGPGRDRPARHDTRGMGRAPPDLRCCRRVRLRGRVSRFSWARVRIPPFQGLAISPNRHSPEAGRLPEARGAMFTQRIVRSTGPPAWTRPKSVLPAPAGDRLRSLTWRPPVASSFYLRGSRGSSTIASLAGLTFYPVLLIVFAMLPAYPLLMLTSACYSVFLGVSLPLATLSCWRGRAQAASLGARSRRRQGLRRLQRASHDDRSAAARRSSDAPASR